MQISKIVITGGPCAGKSTALSWIQNAFTQKGYRVLFVPETATELINGGVAPWSCESNLEYHICHMRLQLEKERIFEQAARGMDCDKILIVCDRGMLDCKAYMTENEFYQSMISLQKNEVELRDNYDAVFHLVTAAKGAENFYTTSNNTARTESVDKAIELDDRLISAWTGHPRLRIIKNLSNFENKMKHLVKEISTFLGEPESYQIERNYLIQYPDLDWLNSIPNCQRIEIVQTYLNSRSDEEKRVRQRGINGNYIYFESTKKKVPGLKRVEIERRLSKDEYLNLLRDADLTKRQIHKTRYCLTYENQYFEIDVYPLWTDKAILEIKLSDENAEIIFPKEIQVIKDITGDETYKNATLAIIK